MMEVIAGAEQPEAEERQGCRFRRATSRIASHAAARLWGPPPKAEMWEEP